MRTMSWIVCFICSVIGALVANLFILVLVGAKAKGIEDKNISKQISD